MAAEFLKAQWIEKNQIPQSQRGVERHRYTLESHPHSLHSAQPKQPSGRLVDVHMNQRFCTQECNWAIAQYSGLFPPLPTSLSEHSEKLWDQSCNQPNTDAIIHEQASKSRKKYI